MNCVLCDTPLGFTQVAVANQPMHQACVLRSVMGGIGHLIAHDYWCLTMNDPDAGLTFRQSAMLVDAFVAVVGVDEAAARV